MFKGTTMVWLGSYGTSQTEVQRFCSVSSLKKAKRALYFNIPGVMFNISLGCLAGMYSSWNISYVIIWMKIYSEVPLRSFIHIITSVTTFLVLGLVIYANYHDCDPLKAKKINKSDQLMPYFVMQVSRNIKPQYLIEYSKILINLAVFAIASVHDKISRHK